ncbi:unnamed protein product [Mycena citricolor]|uniref:Uncharacterized protein n=1 Tax=Mycena citricolor TaxID=2018698 RepID=A0AAD2K7J5_9AGAR|nr:unnamed protein product [Mycena citricolor]
MKTHLARQCSRIERIQRRIPCTASGMVYRPRLRLQRKMSTRVAGTRQANRPVTSGITEKKNTTARKNTKIAIARYTHCTVLSELTESPVCLKNTYDPSTTERYQGDLRTSHVRVCRSLQTPEPTPNDKRRSTKSTETALERRGPHQERTDTLEHQSEDEDGTVAVVAQDPVAVAQRRERVGTEVGRLET